MSALDKLNAKANVKASEVPQMKVQPDIKTEVKETKKIASAKKGNASEKTVKKEKHPGGRTNTRGVPQKDYKMINVAVPIDIYNKLKEASNGNMTFYINNLLKNSVE